MSIRRNKIDLGKTPVTSIFWSYAVPSLMAMIAQSTAGLVDSFFVGQYVGPEGLSAIALTMPIIWLMIGIGAMVAIGGTTLAGIEYGKGDMDKSNNFFNVTVLLLIMASLFAMTLMVLFKTQIASFVGASGLVHTYMVAYSGTIGLFFLFFLLNFAFSFFLKLDSKPLLVVLITLMGTLINVFLDYLMVGKLGMAMEGAALATGLSQLLPWLVFLIVINKKSIWHFKSPLIRGDELWQIIFNGSSELLSNISVAITGTLFNWVIIKHLGVEGIAAYAVALQVSGLAMSAAYGFSESNQSGVSYNFGAGHLRRVSEFKILTQKVNVTAGILFFSLSFFFGEGLASVFVKDLATIKMAGEILKIFSFSYIITGVNVYFGTYYTAVNDPLSSVLVTLLRSLIALSVGLLILPSFFGTMGIWGSVIFAEALTFFYGLWLMKKYPYGRNKESLQIDVKKQIEPVA